MIYDEAQQTIILSYVVSTPSIFARAKPILNPDYFCDNLKPVVAFLNDYSNQYNGAPEIDIVNTFAKGSKLTKYDTPIDDVAAQTFILEKLNEHCKTKALSNAILKCSDMLSKGDTDTLQDVIKEAQHVGIKKDYGIDLWTDIPNWMKKTEKEIGTLPTNWQNFDKKLDGGFGWGQLIYVVSPSGGGKSLALANLGLNFALQGYNVVYYTLELAQELVGKRLLGMASGIAYRDLQSHIDEVLEKTTSKLSKLKKEKGMFRIVDLPQKSTINDLDSRVRELEIEMGKKFSIVIVDYADLMASRDRRIDPNRIDLTGKAIAEDLRGWAKERTKLEQPTIILSASQVGKEAMSDMELNMNDMAGSAWKINTADLIFTVRTSRTMREQGRYEIKILKNRNGGAVDDKLQICYDRNTLLMTDVLEQDNDNGKSNNHFNNPKDALANLASQNTPVKKEEPSNEEQPIQEIIEEPKQQVINKSIPNVNSIPTINAVPGGINITSGMTIGAMKRNGIIQ